MGSSRELVWRGGEPAGGGGPAEGGEPAGGEGNRPAPPDTDEHRGPSPRHHCHQGSLEDLGALGEDWEEPGKRWGEDWGGPGGPQQNRRPWAPGPVDTLD